MVRAELKKNLIAHGGQMALDVRLSIDKGSFVALHGKSGAGKTSVLRMVAGLMHPDEGLVEVDKVFWTDTKNKINIRPQYRQVGFVFQDYALFPNMTVLENLIYALPKGTSHSSLDLIIEMMELEDFRSSRPATLSGGQQQRVALARAIVPKPKLLLLDEPLSALDWETRVKLQGYIRLVHDEYKPTTIMVSHDIPEVLKLSDYVYILKEGAIIKEGPPQNTLIDSEENSTPLDRIGEIIALEGEYVTIMIDHHLHKLPKVDFDDELTVGDKVKLSPASEEVNIQTLKS